MINAQNRKKEGKKNGEGKTKDGRGVKDRRITEGVLIIERLKQRRLEQRRCGPRRNMEGPGWQERLSMN